MQKTPITVVILTDRFDTQFQVAVKSAVFAQEIIVVNNSKNSDEQKRANDLQNQFSFTLVHNTDKIDNFSKVKNKSLQLVKTDWVFFLDSDEVLPKSAQKEIDTLITTNIYDAVSIQRTDIFLQKKLQYGETGTVYITKMFKKSKAKFVRNVHEVVQTTGKIGVADFKLLHYSHLSISHFLQKISFYSLLDSKNKMHSLKQNYFEICIYPIGKFILNYFFKLGFLDGYRGLVYAFIMSLHSLFVRVYFYEKNIQ